jgi:hypothetical protein
LRKPALAAFAGVVLEFGPVHFSTLRLRPLGILRVNLVRLPPGCFLPWALPEEAPTAQPEPLFAPARRAAEGEVAGGQARVSSSFR